MIDMKTVSTRPQAVTALREMARALSAAVDLDDTLTLIAQKMTDVMHVDSCTIYLLEADGQTLRIRATTGLEPQILGTAKLRVGEGMTGLAVEQNTAVYATSAKHHPAFKTVDHSREESFQSLLAIPLVIQEQVIGAMNVQTVAAHHFTADEIETVSLIGDLAAGALAKARLYDQQKSQLAELNALAGMSQAAISPQYLDEMLEIVTELAAETLDVALCVVFLLDETNSFLIQHTDLDLFHREPVPVENSVLGRVVKSGEVVSVRRISAEPLHQNKTTAKSEGLISLLAAPLIVRDKTIGTLTCYTKTEREFSDQQITVLTTLANQTALAINNAELVTQAAVVREMHHRIKNNLQMVAMLMQMQLPDAPQLNTEEVLETNINRIRAIAAVHEVLSEKGFRMVDVKDVVTRIADATMIALTAPQRNITITVKGESLTLSSQRATALSLVINELMQNALEHGFQEKTAGLIEVSFKRTLTHHLVTVRDDGRGLPDTPLTQSLGLEIAETLVADDLNGTLSFNRLEQGTEATIEMPRKSGETA